jgi:hypothetical protein
LKFMRRNGWGRGLVGIIAGQVVALQLLLAGVLASQMAVADSIGALAICHNDASPAGEQPGPADAHLKHGTCAVCAFAAVAPLLPAGQAVALHRQASDLAPARPQRQVVDRARRHDPRSSQGPPQTA